MQEKSFINASKITIPGLEDYRIGTAGRRTSAMSALAGALASAGCEGLDYPHLMGVSGAAFRLQWYQPGWSVQSVCPRSGYDCVTRVLGRIPFHAVVKTAHLASGSGYEDELRREIRERIDEGLPVPVYGEHFCLIAGYDAVTGDFLVRPWNTEIPGYSPVAMSGCCEQPEGFILLYKTGHEPHPEQLALESLDWASFLARSDRYPVPVRDRWVEAFFACGFHAFHLWIDQLWDTSFLHGRDAVDVREMMQANHLTYATLVDARQSAVTYLRRLVAFFGGEMAEHLALAAEAYERAVACLLRRGTPETIAPPPTAIPVKRWDWAMRQEQARRLDAALNHEMTAVREIELATDHCGDSVIGNARRAMAPQHVF